MGIKGTQVFLTSKEITSLKRDSMLQFRLTHRYSWDIVLNHLLKACLKIAIEILGIQDFKYQGEDSSSKKLIVGVGVGGCRKKRSKKHICTSVKVIPDSPFSPMKSKKKNTEQQNPHNLQKQNP